MRARFSVMPKLEALAVYQGETPCTNEDLIRNAAYSWSPMTAVEIEEKTGIRQRLYTVLDLDHISLLAAQAALAKAGRKPDEIGAVIFCSCTSAKMMPSLATWLSGQLGMFQTHFSADIVAACAGLPYGLSEAIRQLQEVKRPVLLVCGEKFSDKIGTVRTSRMIFGDGAAALVVGPAPPGAPPDVEIFQTYASGPMPEPSSYRSFVTFSDPDGNSWLVQEVKTRFPGRGVSNLDIRTLVGFLREAEEHHGPYEATAPKHHWSDWYAAYIVARQGGRAEEDAAKDATTHMDTVLR